MGRALDFDQMNSRKNIDLGYYDTMRVFRQLKGNYYYFDLNVTEHDYMQKFYQVSPEILEELYDVLGIWTPSQPRGFFEEIIPELIRGMELDRSTTYLEFIVSVYEHLGKVYEIPRFEIYDFKKFTYKVYHMARDKGYHTEGEKGIFAIKHLFSKEQKITVALEMLVCYLGGEQ